MKSLSLIILYFLLSTGVAEAQLRGCYPDLTWSGYFTGRTENLFGPGFSSNDDYDPMNYIQPTGMINKSVVYLVWPPTIFNLSSVVEDFQGFRFINCKTKNKFNPEGPYEKLIIIEGGEWFFWDQYSQPNPQQYYFHSNLWAQYEEDLKLPKEKRQFDHHYEVGIVDDGIASISIWSELKETVKGKEVLYAAGNMRTPFLLRTYDTYGIELNGRYPPWVEGDAGPGIGGTISVNFTRQVPSVYVLNGYVDLRRRDLYKANNRLKTVLLKSTKPEFIVEYTFPDYVGFHEIKLPKPSQKIEIEIRSVYPGSRFDDTCISKIFAPQVQLRSDAEREADVQHSLNVYLGREDKR